MLKEALVPGDEVYDSEGYEFKVSLASPHEVVLEASPLAHKELGVFFQVVDRNEQGVWVFRDDPSIYLVDTL